MINMKLIQTTTLFALALGFSNGIMAQEVSYTQGSETNAKLVKQSTLDNFRLGETSYFVTSYMESATMTYYLESYTADGRALSQTKLEIPVGSFNNSFNLDGVVGLGDQAYAFVEHMVKETKKYTLSIRPIESTGKVSSTDTELMSMPFEKVMNSGFYEESVSPDKNTLVICGQLAFDKEQQARFKLAVFDKSLKSVVETEIKLPGEDTKNKQMKVLVANDGSVYLIKRAMNKIGEIVLTAYQVDMSAGTVKEYFIELTEPSYVYTYETALSDNNELIIAGTYYNRATISAGEKKAAGIFFFMNKNKQESVMTNFTLDAPVDNLTARKILVNGNTIYLAAEQFKEERITPPASAAGSTAALDYNYTLIHKNEYVIGIDMDGKRKFELNLPKNFSAHNVDQQYTSAYFISGGKFTMVYNDQRQKFTTESGHGSLIPVVVQITNDGLMQPGVPMIDKIKLPYDRVLYTAKYVQLNDNEIVFLTGKNDIDQYLKLTIR